MAGVIREKAGNLFGTTFAGGDPSSSGIVFKLDGAGTETILHRFRERGDGTGPQTAVIPDGKGNLYGTTSYGGSAGKGVVYEVAAGGHETVLRSFTGNGDGGYPNGPVTLERRGIFRDDGIWRRVERGRCFCAECGPAIDRSLQL